MRQTGELLASASGHGGPILSIDWSFDDGRLATGSADGTAKVWRFDGSTLSEDFRLSADDLAAGVAGVSFSPDGNRLAVGDVGVASTKIFDVSELGGGELFNLEAAAVDRRGDHGRPGRDGRERRVRPDDRSGDRP